MSISAEEEWEKALKPVRASNFFRTFYAVMAERKGGVFRAAVTQPDMKKKSEEEKK